MGQKQTSRAGGHHGLLISRNSLFQIEKHALSAQRLAKWRTLNNGQHPRLQSDKPKQDPTVAISLLGFGQHLERCIFEIGNAAEIERDYFGLHLRNQGPDLVSDELGVREKHQAFHLQQQQARKGFILRMLLRLRSEHVGARFAPKNVDRRIRHLKGQGQQGYDNCNDDPPERSQQYDSSKRNDDPDELSQSDREDRTEFLRVHHPAGVDQHDCGKRCLGHQLDERSEHKHRNQSDRGCDKRRELGVRAGKAVYRGSDVPPPAGIAPNAAPPKFARPVASNSRLGRGGGSWSATNARPAAIVSVKLISAIPSADGQRCSNSEKSGIVNDGKPSGIRPTPCTPWAPSPRNAKAAIPAPTAISGAGPRGNNRSIPSNIAIVNNPTAKVINDKFGRPSAIEMTLCRKGPFEKWMPSSLGIWSITIRSPTPALNPTRTGCEMKLARNPSRRNEASSRMAPTSMVSVTNAPTSASLSPPAAISPIWAPTNIAIVEVVLTLSTREVPAIA